MTWTWEGSLAAIEHELKRRDAEIDRIRAVNAALLAALKLLHERSIAEYARINNLEMRMARAAIAKAEESELLASAKDMLSCLATPSEQVSPLWIIGACERARSAIAKAEESAP